jgi:pSer/pThr/pTyr-binding forkhead associated (FHA) protein
MLRLRFTTFDGLVHAHELKVGTTRIGRTAHNDLQIDELALSSQHAEIRYDGQSIVVRDLDSMAGTYVDGQPVAEAVVKVGQVVSLGSFLIRLEDSTTEPAADSQQALQTVRLQDGSYSCFRHSTRRALYECEGCFDLACEECVGWIERMDGTKVARCKSCGAACRTIDWSGLERTTTDVVKEVFVPKKVKQALDLWDKHKDKLKFKRD